MISSKILPDLCNVYFYFCAHPICKILKLCLAAEMFADFKFISLILLSKGTILIHLSGNKSNWKYCHFESRHTHDSILRESGLSK